MTINSEQAENDPLITEVRKGDQQALAALFRRYENRLQKMIELRMDARLRGRLDAADVLQESFLVLSQKLTSFNEKHPDKSLFVWMRKVVMEQMIDIYRKQVSAKKRSAKRDISIDQRRPQDNASSIALAAHLLGQVTSGSSRAAKDELHSLLLETIDAMEPVDREVIMLRSFEELSNAETAEILGLSHNGASNRYVRAMTRLKKELQSIRGFRD